MIFEIITTTYNSEKTIEECESSIKNQQIENLIWLVIDGKSTDNTIKLLDKSTLNKNVVSEKDDGLYYAYNKGIKLLEEDSNKIVNFLDSDNKYSDENVCKSVLNIFNNYDVDIVICDLAYVNEFNKVIRYWKSIPNKKPHNIENNVFFYKDFVLKDLLFGWSMSLPTIFIKENVLKKIGLFNTNYKICSDYDWTTRASLLENIKIAYLPKICINMKFGGVSNRYSNLLKIKIEDFKIIFNLYKKLNVRFALFRSFFTLLFKNLRKIPQFFFKIS